MSVQFIIYLLINLIQQSINVTIPVNYLQMKLVNIFTFIHSNIIIIFIYFIFIETNESVNINSNLIENLPLYSMLHYAQDGSIYDSQQLEKVYYFILYIFLKLFFL